MSQEPATARASVGARYSGKRAPCAEPGRGGGVARDFFDLHVLPDLRVVRKGRRVFVPVSEISRWLEREARRTLEVER